MNPMPTFAGACETNRDPSSTPTSRFKAGAHGRKAITRVWQLPDEIGLRSHEASDTGCGCGCLPQN